MFHFAFGAFLLSPASMIRKLRTLVTTSSGHKHVKQYRKTTLASKRKQKKKVRFEPEVSLSLSTQHTCRTQSPWFSGGGTFPGIYPRPCERGLRIDVRHVWTLQNGSFLKQIFLKTYYRKRGSASYIVRQWLLWEVERERETPVTSLISRWNREWSCIWLPRRRVDPTRRRVLTLSLSSARTSKCM